MATADTNTAKNDVVGVYVFIPLIVLSILGVVLSRMSESSLDGEWLRGTAIYICIFSLAGLSCTHLHAQRGEGTSSSIVPLFGTMLALTGIAMCIRSLVIGVTDEYFSTDWILGDSRFYLAIFASLFGFIALNMAHSTQTMISTGNPADQKTDGRRVLVRNTAKVGIVFVALLLLLVVGFFAVAIYAISHMFPG